MNSINPGKKDIVVILNGISLHKKLFYHKFYSRLSKLCNLQVFETKSKNHAIFLASQAAENYVDVVLAAGGDGTLHQVVNGILEGREKETKLPVVGLIPIGSGNDFARTVNIRADPQQLENLINKYAPQKIDIGRIAFTRFSSKNAMGSFDESQSEKDIISEAKAHRYFVNVADMGMGPAVVEKVLNSGRPFGPEVAYYKSIISTFLTYKPMKVKAVSENWIWEGKIRTLAVANGKFYGHGLCVAPDAKINDRVFSTFICGNVSVFDFIRYSGTLKKCKYIRIPKIHYKETVSLELSSDEPCLIEGDGEILGMLPAKIQLIERQLNFLL